MTQKSNFINTSKFSILFVVILGLFFLYLIVNYVMNQSFTIEAMNTSNKHVTKKPDYNR